MESQKAIPKEIKEIIEKFIKEGYNIDVYEGEYIGELDVCNTSTSIASCKSTVECLYGNCHIDENMNCQEFPAYTYLCTGIARVKARAPSAIRYYLNDDFGAIRKLIIVI